MKTKTCKYCYSEIPEQASKCKYCLEWQDKTETFIKQETHRPSPREYKVDGTKLVKPFQLLLVEKIKFPYMITVIIIGALCFATIQFMWYRLDEDTVYLLSFLSGALQLIFTWTCLIWIYHVIKDNFSNFVKVSSLEDIEAENKFYEFQNKIFNKKWSIIFGIVVGLIASLGDFYLDAPFKTIQAKIIFASFEFIMMFFAGAAVYSMLFFAIFLYHIDVKTDIMTMDQKRSINKIGSIHLKTSLLAIIPFFLGVMIKLFGDWNWDLLVILWYISFALAIIVYIYWPMINVHNLMQNDIDNQITIVQRKIRTKLAEINLDPSSSNFAKLRELRDLEKSVSNQNSWPFDAKSLSAAFAAVIFPIVLMIIDKLWQI